MQVDCPFYQQPPPPIPLRALAFLCQMNRISHVLNDSGKGWRVTTDYVWWRTGVNRILTLAVYRRMASIFLYVLSACEKLRKDGEGPFYKQQKKGEKKDTTWLCIYIFMCVLHGRCVLEFDWILTSWMRLCVFVWPEGHAVHAMRGYGFVSHKRSFSLHFLIFFFLFCCYLHSFVVCLNEAEKS